MVCSLNVLGNIAPKSGLFYSSHTHPAKLALGCFKVFSCFFTDAVGCFIHRLPQCLRLFAVVIGGLHLDTGHRIYACKLVRYCSAKTVLL